MKKIFIVSLLTLSLMPSQIFAKEIKIHCPDKNNIEITPISGQPNDFKVSINEDLDPNYATPWTTTEKDNIIFSRSTATPPKNKPEILSLRVTNLINYNHGLLCEYYVSNTHPPLLDIVTKISTPPTTTKCKLSDWKNGVMTCALSD